MTNNIKPFPVSMEAPDDRLLITMSDGNVIDKGRLSGYPGTQMSELGVDSLGTAYWVDPLGTRTDISSLFNRTNISYHGDKIGIYQGIDAVKEERFRKIILNTETVDTHPHLAYLNPWGSKYTTGYDTVTAITEFADLCTFTFTNPTHPSWSGVNTQRITNSGGYRWSNSGGEFLWTFDEVITLSGFRYVGQDTTTYRFRSVDLEHSMNGIDWFKVDPAVNRYGFNFPDGITEFDKPISCRYFRLTEHAGSNTGIRYFNLLINRENLVLPVPVNTEWYDQEELILEETDDSFKLRSRYDFSPSIETFNPVSISNKSIFRSMWRSGDVTVSNDVIMYTDVVTNPLGIERLGKSLILPRGHYILEYNDIVELAGKNREIFNMIVTLPKLGERISTMGFDNITANRRGTVLRQGRFEFYLPMEDYVYMQRTGETNNLSIPIDRLNSELIITKVSDEPTSALMMDLPGHIRYHSLFRNFTIDDLSMMTNTNVPGNPIARTNILSGKKGIWNVGSYNLTDGELRYLEINFPEPVSPDLWSYRAPITVQRTPNFRIEIFDGVEWISVVSNTATSNLTKDEVGSGLIDLPTPSRRWRLVILDNVPVDLGDFKLHVCDVPRFAPCIVPTTLGTSVTYPNVVQLLKGASADEVFNSPFISAGRYYKMSLDGKCNIYIRRDTTMLEQAEYLTLTNVYTQEVITSHKVDFETSDYMKAFDNIEAGFWSLATDDGNASILNMYFEKVSN